MLGSEDKKYMCSLNLITIFCYVPILVLSPFLEFKLQNVSSLFSKWFFFFDPHFFIHVIHSCSMVQKLSSFITMCFFPTTGVGAFWEYYYT